MSSDGPERDAQPAPSRESLRLSDGTTAELISRDGGWILEIDGIRQSHVTEAGQPPPLASARWMLAALGPRRSTVAHLGGALLTLPRAVAAVRPETQQTVVELDPVLVDLVRRRFEIPEHITLEVADARAWLASATPTWDAIVIDIFAGGRIPPAFTSRECFASAKLLLSTDGVLVINSVAGGDLLFTRRELATLEAVFEHVALIVQGSALHGLRFGNAILIGSDQPIEVERIKAALAGDPSRGALVTDLTDLIGDAAVVVDADELWSPVPDLPDTGPVLRLLDGARSLGSVFRDAPKTP